MKFKVSADELSLVARTCVRGLNSKDPHSQTVFKINEDETKLLIFCTTQTNFFKGAIKVFDVEREDGEVSEWSVDGTQLKTILSILPHSTSIPVEFVMNSTARTFVIKITGNTFKLPVYDTISPYTEETRTKIAVVPANDFVNKISLIGKIVSTAAEDEDMSVSCLHVIFDKDKIRLMGTDNYSMTEEKIDYTLEGKEDKILIPSGQISLLSRTFESTDEIALISTPTKFGYVDKQGIVSLVSKSSLSPIAYETRVSTATSDCEDETVTINSSDFRQAISALSKLAPNSNMITMKVEENQLVFSNVNEDIMTVGIDEYNASETTLYFDKRPLQNIEALLSDKIKLGWSSDEYDLFVKFSNFKTMEDDTLAVDENVFIGVSLNDE